MAHRRATHRYPRPGEPIAPQTLREFLMEPIPRRLLGKGEASGAKLCDLDETAWQRFPAEAIRELARMVVDRMMSHYGGSAFRNRQCPRPPQGTRLEDLRLENRTRRCLAREGYEDSLESLGCRSIAEIMAIRAFGPRCLVDLLSALEAAQRRPAADSDGGKHKSRLSEGLAAAAGREGTKHKSRLSEALTAAAKQLAELPAARLVCKDDLRFGRLLESLDVEASTAASAAERLLARTRNLPDSPRALQQVRELTRRIAGLGELTLEEELVQVFGRTANARNLEILLGYYGWEDGRHHTLSEIGARFGITRERVRQVCARLTRHRKNLPTILAPVMDRALQIIAARLPCPAAALEAELVEQKLTAVGMRLEGVVAGAELLARAVPFRLVKIDGSRLAVRPDQVDTVSVIVDAAKKEIYFHGLSTIRRIERLVSEKFSGRAGLELVSRTLPLAAGFSWLDQRSGWFRLLPINKHGLPKTIDKVLAVAGEVTVSQLRAALGRNRRLWKDPPPEKVLLEFCRQAPGVRIEGNRIISTSPRNWKKSLTGVEAKLVAVLKKHGPVMERGALEDLCVAGGMNRFSFHAFVSWSPVITQLGHSVYALLGADIPAQKVASLVASRRAKRAQYRVLRGHGRTADGKIWLNYRLSKAASTYAVITVPAALKSVVDGRFKLVAPDGSTIGTLATKDGRAWGLGAFLRQRGARIDDQIVLTLDLKQRTAAVSWGDEKPA